MGNVSYKTNLLCKWLASYASCYDNFRTIKNNNMTTIAPKKLTLTCTVTGKQTTWTNQSIIQSKIDKFGSLEAFVAQYKCKGAGNAKTIKPVIVSPGKEQNFSYTQTPLNLIATSHGYEQGECVIGNTLKTARVFTDHKTGIVTTVTTYKG